MSFATLKAAARLELLFNQAASAGSNKLFWLVIHPIALSLTRNIKISIHFLKRTKAIYRINKYNHHKLYF
jgi:hypothetical protein